MKIHEFGILHADFKVAVQNEIALRLSQIKPSVNRPPTSQTFQTILSHILSAKYDYWLSDEDQQDHYFVSLIGKGRIEETDAEISTSVWLENKRDNSTHRVKLTDLNLIPTGASRWLFTNQTMARSFADREKFITL